MPIVGVLNHPSPPLKFRRFPKMSRKRIDRRRFLQIAQWAGLSSLITGCGARAGEATIHRFWEPVNQRTQELIFNPNRLSPKFSDQDLQPDQLLVNDLRFNRGLEQPQIDPDTYQLEILGGAENPTFMSLQQIKELLQSTVIMRHVCVEGWAAIVKWTGVPLHVLADHVGRSEESRYVYFFSADDYYESWDLASALHPQTLLVYGMNDQELPPAHGAPLRLASPVKLGYKQSKWVLGMAFTTELFPDQRGYWEERGYEWYAGL